MSILTIEELNYELPDKVLYQDSSLTLNAGEHIGLTGKNGAGKSTLIKILIDEVLPDSGKITWQNNIKIGYLEQYLKIEEEQSIREFLKSAFSDLYKLEQEIQEHYDQYAIDFSDESLAKAGEKQAVLEQKGFYEIEQQIERMAFGLGITAIGLDKKLVELSGGQRSKVFLAKLLLEEPDVLLLDEPTNYLDDSHVQWLSEFLSEFEGAYLVISHDAYFLDSITTYIADIEFGKIKKYPGNLNKALKLKEIANENYLKEFHAQQEKINKLESYIRKNKAGSRSTIAKSREKQLNKIDRIVAPEKIVTSTFNFPYKPTLVNYIVETTDLGIGYKEELLPRLNIIIQRGEKVAINGFNGIGKSTLLKTIMGEIPALNGVAKLADGTDVSYFSQELIWESDRMSPFDVVRQAYPDLVDKEVRQFLARAGIQDDNVKKSLKYLSGGEQTKVKLSLMTVDSSNVLILDEPTNHLDKETKRALRKAISTYEGTVLLVSHEKEFYTPFIDRVINIEDLS